MKGLVCWMFVDGMERQYHDALGGVVECDEEGR